MPKCLFKFECCGELLDCTIYCTPYCHFPNKGVRCHLKKVDIQNFIVMKTFNYIPWKKSHSKLVYLTFFVTNACCWSYFLHVTVIIICLYYTSHWWIYISPLQIKEYEKLQFLDERLIMAKEIYDNHIMTELLARSHVSS